MSKTQLYENVILEKFGEPLTEEMFWSEFKGSNNNKKKQKKANKKKK